MLPQKTKPRCYLWSSTQQHKPGMGAQSSCPFLPAAMPRKALVKSSSKVNTDCRRRGRTAAQGLPAEEPPSYLKAAQVAVSRLPYEMFIPTNVEPYSWERYKVSCRYGPALQEGDYYVGTEFTCMTTLTRNRVRAPHCTNTQPCRLGVSASLLPHGDHDGMGVPHSAALSILSNLSKTLPCHCIYGEHKGRH